jgi:hypothetical protein
MAQLDLLFESLAKELSALEARYLQKYFPADPAVKPEDFEYDVKAFCLLAHASFEEFVEGVSELIMGEIEAQFLQKKITLSAALFMLTYGESPSIADRDEVAVDSCFDIVRNTLKEGKQKHSKVLKDNHGFSLKYLRGILIPVGLNVPQGIELDSLKKLSDARGSYAHTRAKKALYGEYKSANNPMVPEDAKRIVDDCLVLCAEIKRQSLTRW